ncbi:MAG: type VI secretion system baseplate subunit TssK, partial [Alphaproteobacteria bacterium]|nr:type VI secretion system baseplate subunit TssK [Alphaproteobacteria bacterium]
MPRSARELPDAIQWHEGMLLAPQHFQQLAVRGEELIAYHTATSSPFHWGIRHLKVDPVQLVSGIFRVLELEAVLPDGLIVTHVQGED